MTTTKRKYKKGGDRDKLPPLNINIPNPLNINIPNPLDRSNTLQKIDYKTKLYSPLGIRTTNNQTNILYESDDERKFSPKLELQILSMKPETQRYEYFVKQFTDNSIKHTDKTMALYEKNLITKKLIKPLYVS